MSVLDIEQEMDWNPAVSNVNHAPLSLYDDGGIIYYKYVEKVIGSGWNYLHSLPCILVSLVLM